MTPSVVFSAMVSTVAQMISDPDRAAVSRPTMRATRARPFSTETARASATPRPSTARHLADRAHQAMTHMPANRATGWISASTDSAAAVAAMAMSTVETVRIGAAARRLPPRRRRRFSAKEIHFPIQMTGCGQPSGSPMSKSSPKPTSIAAMFV